MFCTGASKITGQIGQVDGLTVFGAGSHEPIITIQRRVREFKGTQYVNRRCRRSDTDCRYVNNVLTVVKAAPHGSIDVASLTQSAVVKSAFTISAEATAPRCSGSQTPNRLCRQALSTSVLAMVAKS